MRSRPFDLGENWTVLEQREDGLAARSRDGFMVIASWGMGWEHVSVSRSNRTPTWEEMCRIKDLFWGSEECVVQYHPPKADYRNLHKYCLHLWKPIGVEIPRPAAIMVAP